MLKSQIRFKQRETANYTLIILALGQALTAEQHLEKKAEHVLSYILSPTELRDGDKYSFRLIHLPV